MSGPENTTTQSVSSGSTFVSILDETLQTGMAQPGRLLCTLDTGFISLATVDGEQNKFSGFEVFRFPKPPGEAQFVQKIAELTQQSYILKKFDFRNVSVQVVNPSFTFIPAALFRKEDAGSYFYFNHPQRSDDVIHYEEIRGYDAVSIFAVSGQLLTALKNLVENFSMHHHLTSLLLAARYFTPRQSSKSVFIHVHSSLLDVVVVEERRLIFANSFPYKSAEDAVYFTLMVFTQLSLNPEKTDVVLSGEIEKDDAVSTQLRNYIRHLSFGERIKAAGFTYGFDELPSHYYHGAFSHILCGS